MKKILLPIVAFIYSANISAAPLTLDCQSSTELDENLRDIAAATTGGAGGADDCPAPKTEAINALCGEIQGQARDEDEESQFNHLYEKSLWNMSCANPFVENMETGKLKVQRMWAKHHKSFKCNRVDFVVADGNILKYGVQNTFEEFITKIIGDYKLNMNFKDPKDGKTVLDFAIDEYERAQKISATASKTTSMKKMVDLLKANGAKQAKDL